MQFHSGGSTISGPRLSGQPIPRVATTLQPDLRVAASMALDGSSGSGSTSTSREVSAAVVVAEKAVEMRTTKETMTLKAAEEATADNVVVEKVAMDKAVAMEAAEEAMVKAAVDAATMKTAD
jgi:hypothetical protein